MVEKKTLLIRADATPEMGSGHVMRCLALAQAWKRIGGKSLFVSAAVPDMLADRLRNSGIALKRISVEYGSETDSAVTSATASVEHAAWSVIDGYQFTSRYYQRLKSCGSRVLVMDDVCHTDRYDVDAILNQNPYASEEVYRSRGSDASLFLGTRYVLLRRIPESRSLSIEEGGRRCTYTRYHGRNRPLEHDREGCYRFTESSGHGGGMCHCTGRRSSAV